MDICMAMSSYSCETENEMKKKYSVSGMSCSVCSNLITNTVQKLEGIHSVNVNLLDNSMEIETDSDDFDENRLIGTIEALGYGVSDYFPNKQADSIQKKYSFSDLFRKPSFRRFGLSSVCLIILLYLNMGPMWGLKAFDSINPYLQFAFSLYVLILNREYFIKGFRGMVNRLPGMDALISIGAGAGFLYSTFTVLHRIVTKGLIYADCSEYAGRLYFESSAMIFVIITIGKLLESDSKRQTLEAVNSLRKLAPKKVFVLVGNEEKEKGIDELMPKDVCVVRSGSVVPADGTVIIGSAAIDESALTGESVPKEVFKNSKVYAGCKCLEGCIYFEVESVGGDTALARIVDMASEVCLKKAPIERLADKVSGIFVPIVVSISIVTFAVWLVLGYEIYLAVKMAISVLVVSCPCALGLATPTAIMAATGNAASKGILIKSAECLEVAGRVQRVIFDKTGTLTEGRLNVSDIISLNDRQENELLKTAAILENSISHPYAVAIRRYALSRFSFDEIMNVKVKNVERVEGGGIKASIKKEPYMCGNKKLMQDNGIDVSLVDGKVEELSKEGKTVLYVAGDGLLGILALKDSARPDSTEALKAIEQLGIGTSLCTGDNAVTAEAVAKELGFSDVYSEVNPSEKMRIVDEYKSKGCTVAMVGDGINDSIALLGADIGISLKSGTDIAIDSADIIVMNSSVSGVYYILALGKRTLKIIRQNLFWAFFYNLCAIPIAAGIMYIPFGIALSPTISAIAMSFSSLFVCSNALRLKK